MDASLVVAALLAAVSLAYQTFARPLRRHTADKQQEPVRRLADEERPFLIASRLDLVSGSDTLLAFTDYQCPACKRFEGLLRAFAHMAESELTIGYLHFPLPSHPRAIFSANLAECANRLGQFSAAHFWLFAAQDTLICVAVAVAVAALPRSARLRDSVAFVGCVRQSDASTAVIDATALARRLGVRATPTLIVNGWLTGVPIDAGELAEWFRRSRRSDPPYLRWPHRGCCSRPADFAPNSCSQLNEPTCVLSLSRDAVPHPILGSSQARQPFRATVTPIGCYRSAPPTYGRGIRFYTTQHQC